MPRTTPRTMLFFRVGGWEEPVAYPFRFRAGGRDLEMKFAGIADRIDTLDDGR